MTQDKPEWCVSTEQLVTFWPNALPDLTTCLLPDRKPWLTLSLSTSIHYTRYLILLSSSLVGGIGVRTIPVKSVFCTERSAVQYLPCARKEIDSSACGWLLTTRLHLAHALRRPQSAHLCQVCWTVVQHEPDCVKTHLFLVPWGTVAEECLKPSHVPYFPLLFGTQWDARPFSFGSLDFSHSLEQGSAERQCHFMLSGVLRHG
jgi:hypothetical protein